jgi:hypothetical protein
MSCLSFVTNRSYLLFLVLLVYFKCYLVPPKERQSTDACRIKKDSQQFLCKFTLLTQLYVQQRREYLYK